MGKSKWFCPTAKPRPDHILKKYFKFFLRLTAMVEAQATFISIRSMYPLLAVGCGDAAKGDKIIKTNYKPFYFEEFIETYRHTCNSKKYYI